MLSLKSQGIELMICKCLQLTIIYYKETKYFCPLDNQLNINFLTS